MLTATAYRPAVEQSGVTFLPPAVAPDRDYNHLDATFPEIRRLPNPEALARLFGAIAVQHAPAQGHDVVTASAAWRPDVLINDGIALGAPLAAGLLRLPLTTVSPFIFCTIPAPELPPPFLGIPWQPGPRGRLTASALNRAADLRLAVATRRWQALAAAWKVSPPFQTAYQAGVSPLLYLYPGGPALEYPRRAWPAQAHGVGPLRLMGADAGQSAPTTRPRVFLTEGTTHTDRRLARLAIQALRAAPLELVIALGDLKSGERLGPLPANVTLAGYVDYRVALKGAALLVTNGGAGSLTAALEAGVPALMLPAGLDKGEASQRLAWAGAGLRLPAAARCSPARFRAAAMAVIQQPAYRQRAQTVGQELLALGGAARAAELLASIAKPSPSRTAVPLGAGRHSTRATVVASDQSSSRL